MSERADIHRPSAINPIDYAFLGCFYQGSSEDMMSAYTADHADLEAAAGDAWWERTAPSGNFAQQFSCDHCGAHFSHGVVFRHEPTGELIATGHICAHTVMLPGTTQMDRKRALAERKAQALKTERLNREYREGLLAETPGLAEALETDHYIVQDIARRFHGSNPSLSEKQIALVFKLQREAEERAVERAEQEAKATPVIEGKGVVVTGKVLSTKWVEGYYDSVLKMLVLDDRGFKVWGTVPSALDVKRQDRVSFTANIEVSHDDETFGFFKRPRLAVNLTQQGQEAA